MFKLILKNAFRHRMRTLLTIVGLAISILAFGLLRTAVSAWYTGVEASSQTRLITRNAVSLVFALPLSYKEKILGIPGVTGISYAYWFGGTYIDMKNFFPQFAVEPESYLDLHPEYALTEKEKEDFLKQRNSCVVGAALVRKHGWKLGDTVRLTGTIFAGDWDLVIRGVYHGSGQFTDENQMLLHWQYVDETMQRVMPEMSGYVGWYMVRIAGPDDAARVSAAIDSRFENSLAETKTETERAFNMSFISMLSAIITALRLISVVIVAIMLLVLANTMTMTARERIPEYAVLKAVGFRAQRLSALIIGESVLIAIAGGLVGILSLFPTCAAFSQFVAKNLSGFFPVFRLAYSTIGMATAITIVVGIVAGLFPTFRVARMKTADGLRHIG
ncbi:ABC transporter permease [Candidatus Poribacteria bacterium]|nr:ABC transporter permease [Candidatus Poribacteria bacterium]